MAYPTPRSTPRRARSYALARTPKYTGKMVVRGNATSPKTPRRNLMPALLRAAKAIGGSPAVQRSLRQKVFPKYSARKRKRGYSSSSSSSEGQRSAGYQHSAVYVGNFGKTKSKADIFTKYSKSGVLTTKENTATVTATHCAYVGHSAVAPKSLLNNVCRALIRAIWYKVFDIDLAENGAALTNPEGLNWFEVRTKSIVTGNIGVAAQINTTLAASDTWGELAGALENALAIVDFNLEILDSVGFSINQGSTPLKRMSLSQAMVDICVVSQLKVQNATNSVTGSGDAENVTAVPLQGRKYHLSRLFTRLAAFSTLPTSPVTIDKNTGITYGWGPIGYREPPVPSALVNCTGATWVRLEPGHIKKDSLKFKRRMSLNQFMRSLKISNIDAQFYNSSLGGFNLFALEKQIGFMTNDVAPSPIQLRFEQNVRQGVKVSVPMYSHQEEAFLHNALAPVVEP